MVTSYKYDIDGRTLQGYLIEEKGWLMLSDGITKPFLPVNYYIPITDYTVHYGRL